jgi:hypothetical protein
MGAQLNVKHVGQTTGLGLSVASTQFDLFRAALREANPDNALHRLALALRDNGSTQLELYALFVHLLRRLSPEDPRYDAVADNAELVWGGPWAKGADLFPNELTHESVKSERSAPPAPWIEIDVYDDRPQEQELARELAPGHILENRAGRALMRRTDCDDVLFAVRNSAEVALVHLTWSGNREQPGFPHTRIFASMLDWFDEVENQTPT